MTMIRTVGLLAGAATLSASGFAGATDIESASIDTLRAELTELRAQNESLEARVDAQDNAWLNETRATEIRGIVQDVLADSQTRTSLQDSGAMAGYKAGNGFFLSSQNGSFTMHIKGQVQARWVMSHIGDDENTVPNTFAGQNNTDWGFQVRRAKVKFQGNVVDKTWHYQVNGEFGQNGNGGAFQFQEAMITHDMNDNMSLTFGQFKAPWLREELVSSANQLAVERSLVNEYFNMDRVVGVMLGYKTDAWKLDVAYNNGGMTPFNNPNAAVNPYRNTSSANNPTKYAVQGRFEYKMSGDWSDFDSFTSSPGDDQAMMIGFAAMTQSWNGQLAGQFSDEASVWGVTADFSAKFSGVSIFAAVTYQNYDFGTTLNNAGDEIGNINPWGFVGQVGYSLNDEWEVFGRFSWANNRGIDAPAGAAAVDADAKLSLLTVGANYFINSNVKFTADWGLNLNDSLNGVWVDQAATGWRATNAGNEWVLRAQLQLLF
jgi:outer membrane murein-binding lipoprotein Lpp